jgi:hypothetical protein
VTAARKPQVNDQGSVSRCWPYAVRLTDMADDELLAAAGQAAD